MIVKMRKVTILVSKNSLNTALINLRKLGVVHIIHLRKPHADYIDKTRQRLFRIDKVLKLIGKSEKQTELSKEELISAPKEIINLFQEKNKIEEDLRELRAKISWFETWGDITRQDLNQLAEKNIFVRLYLCTKKDFKKIKKGKLVYSLGQKGANLQIAYITTDRRENLNLKEAKPPEGSFKSLKAKIDSLNRDKERIKKDLSKFSLYRDCFKRYKNNLVEKFEFIKVKFGMARSESLSWLQGYCPVNSAERVKKIADEKGWGIVLEKPDKPEKVPTLLRNPKWVEIIKPVFNFMGTLPGYREYDISFWFLLFFSLFFAMLIGDAGYGFIFFIATYFLRRKFKKAPAALFVLFFLLSSTTIIWGALSGTWFGAENIAKSPFFNYFIIDKINSFVSSNQRFMIYLCFIIGVVHLSIAHLIKAFRYLNSFKALAEIGWVCILWAAFFLAGKLVLDRPVSEFALPLGAIGAAAVILFSNFQKNILKGALNSLGTLPLDIVSSFSDIVSYLRLFAVGYATVAVAAAFNGMAANTGLEGFLGGLVAAFILFLGHGLNILLGLMSVIVHGIRLNMLEFSGQLGMEWSGEEYRPFRE